MDKKNNVLLYTYFISLLIHVYQEAPKMLNSGIATTQFEACLSCLFGDHITELACSTQFYAYTKYR